MKLLLRMALLPGLCLLSAVASAQTPASPAKAAPTSRQLVIGVKVAPPFVIEKDGHYSGLAIDLWQEIAADHGWTFTYKPYDLDSLLNAVSDNQVDVAVGAITATASREQRMDSPTRSPVRAWAWPCVADKTPAGWR